MKDILKNGIGEICGLFTWGHILLLVISIILIAVLLKYTYKLSNEKKIKIIKIVAIIVTVLEILKIIWNLTLNDPKLVNNYLPLHFCSLLIYATLFAGFGKGKLQKTGLLFLNYGSFVAGVCFLFYPITSLAIWPVLHVLSFHSMFYHTAMAYCGLLVLTSDLIKRSKEDIIPYMISILVVVIVAWTLNIIFGSNFMFISDPYINALLIPIWNTLGPVLYGLIIISAEIFGTFYLTYFGYKLINKFKKEKE